MRLYNFMICFSTYIPWDRKVRISNKRLMLYPLPSEVKWREGARRGVRT